MADNWLEKREQQLRSGGSITYRKDNPSLEVLLHRLVALESAQSLRADAPKQAQLEAIARGARILFPDLEIVCDEPGAEIQWSPGKLTAEQTGAAILAMQLKACELGFTAVRREESSLKVGTFRE